MARKLDYRWHLRQVMARRGMFSTTDLIPPLAARGIRLSSSQVYRLVVDRPERLSLKVQAEAFGSIDDQPVDLAGGQTDSSCGQGWDQVGGGEHPAAGHHLAQVPPVVEFACHQDSLPLPARHVQCRSECLA